MIIITKVIISTIMTVIELIVSPLQEVGILKDTAPHGQASSKSYLMVRQEK